MVIRLQNIFNDELDVRGDIVVAEYAHVVDATEDLDVDSLALLASPGLAGIQRPQIYCTVSVSKFLHRLPLRKMMVDQP